MDRIRVRSILTIIKKINWNHWGSNPVFIVKSDTLNQRVLLPFNLGVNYLGNSLKTIINAGLSPILTQIQLVI